MRMSRALPAALVAGGFAIASLFFAAPASAATLPAGQKITVVDTNTWQFSHASPVDATLTPYGPAPVIPFEEYVEAVDVDDDGRGYAFSTWYEYTEPVECGEEEPECEPAFGYFTPFGATLYVADAAAGKLSSGIRVEVMTDPEDPESWEWAESCLAIDYSGGTILAACNIYGDDGPDTAYIGQVDPDTARLYPDTIVSGEDFVELQAIAKNPKTSTIYGFGTDHGVFILTLEEGPLMGPGSIEWAVTAADYDRDGVLWVSAYYPQGQADRALLPGEQGLAIFDPETGEFPFDAVWTEPEAVIFALTVWGKETLPATGPAPAAPIAAGAAGLLMLGSLLAAGALLRRRAAAQ